MSCIYVVSVNDPLFNTGVPWKNEENLKQVIAKLADQVSKRKQKLDTVVGQREVLQTKLKELRVHYFQNIGMEYPYNLQKCDMFP